MAIPVLQLNLVPPPTMWRQNHEALGLAAVLGGVLALALAGGFSIHKYVQASREGRRIVSISSEAKKVAQEQARVVESLRLVDTAERLPRYRLAERIFLERALPWSRLTAELERNLVQDVRIRSLQRLRASDGSVSLKLRGEARSRPAEAKFIEALQGNGMFLQVVLEREAERAGGGIDFDLSLPVSSAPPPFEPLAIPPAQKVDQFGKPLLPGAKILRSLSAPGGKAMPVTAGPKPAPAPAPARTPAATTVAPLKPVQPQAPAQVRPQQEQRVPAFNRGMETTVQPQTTAPQVMEARPRPPRKTGSEGGAP